MEIYHINNRNFFNACVRNTKEKINMDVQKSI